MSFSTARSFLPFTIPLPGADPLPLEAQRLGLESYASDLNPVAVLINKAMIEIPPRFAGRPPVNPEARANMELIDRQWKGALGLAEDVRYYGQWMRNEAEKRIGYLYPTIEITDEMIRERPDLVPYRGLKLTVIAWLWARTVKSPNPAFAHIDVPLASTFMLSTKAGKEAYVEPVIENGGYRFTVKVGKPKNPEAAKSGTKLARVLIFSVLCRVSLLPVIILRLKVEQGAWEQSSWPSSPRGIMAVSILPRHKNMNTLQHWRNQNGNRKLLLRLKSKSIMDSCLWTNLLWRPIHPPPARCPHHLLRPGRRGHTAYRSGCPCRRPRSRQASPARRRHRRPRLCRGGRGVFGVMRKQTI
jgi:hypothetical protein